MIFINLKARFAREAILKNDGVNHLLIEVTPPVKKDTSRKPSLMIFVIDKSGSMDMSADAQIKHRGKIHVHEMATKLDYAKNSTIKFLSLMKGDDLP